MKKFFEFMEDLIVGVLASVTIILGLIIFLIITVATVSWILCPIFIVLVASRFLGVF